MACPAWVRGKAREHWAELSQMLESMRLASPYYSLPLALLVDALADWVEYSRLCDETPPVVETDKGNRVQEPLVGMKNKAWQRVLAACREFGMTPAALRGIEVPEEHRDELDALLA